MSEVNNGMPVAVTEPWTIERYAAELRATQEARQADFTAHETERKQLLAATAELRRELEEVKRERDAMKRQRDDYWEESSKGRDYILRLSSLLGCADGDDLPEHRIDTLKREVEELRGKLRRAEVTIDELNQNWIDENL